MLRKSLLSHDELAYIQQILGTGLSNGALPTPTFRVDGGATANALLAGLGRHAELTLDANFGDQRLSFPLQLVEDEFHALHLELGAPGIFQQGATQRSWRLVLERPVTLLNKNGHASSLRVYQISPSGVLLDNAKQRPLPNNFNLWLPLPGQEPIKLCGRRVRDVSTQLSAFRLDILPGNHSERLRHFIFQQHRLAHPQLQPQQA